MADYSDFLDAPEAGKHDAFLDDEAPRKPIRIKPPEGGLTEKQLLHRDDGAVVTNTLPRFNPGESLGRTANLLGGATSVVRGTANIVGKAFGGTKWGDSIWPTEFLDKDSGAYITGQLADPGAMLIGGVAGKAVQALPFVSKAEKAIEVANAANKVASRGAQTVSRVVAPGVTGAATGGAVGYLSSEGDLRDAGQGAMYGGAGGAILPSATKAIASGLGGLWDRVTGRVGQVHAGEIGRKAAGDQLPQIRQALADAPDNITAGQATVGVNQPAFAALDAFAKTKGGQSKYYYDLAKEQAAGRQGLLTGVTPDLAAAETQLKTANAVNYGYANRADDARLAALQTSVRPPAPVTVPSPMGLGVTERVPGTVKAVSTIRGISDIQETPAFQAAVKVAKDKIRDNVNIPKEVRTRLADDPTTSLQGLHFIKMAIDDRFKNPSIPTSLQTVGDAELTAIKNTLTSAMKLSSPEYDAARRTATALNKPVAQAKVLTSLAETLDNQVGNERVLPFTNALGRGENSALRRAGVDPRFGDIADVLTPKQMGAVSEVERQVIRDKTLAHQATVGAGDLVGIDTKLRLPNVMDQKAALMNKVLEYADKFLNESTYKAIAAGMRNGKTATEMLDALPTSERNKALMIFSRAGQELANIGQPGAAIGNTAGNK